MSCEQFEQRIDIVMDRRVVPSDDPFLQHHALNCVKCRQLLSEYQELFSLMNSKKQQNNKSCINELPNPVASRHEGERGFATVLSSGRDAAMIADSKRNVWQLVTVACMLIGLIPLMAVMNRSEQNLQLSLATIDVPSPGERVILDRVEPGRAKISPGKTNALNDRTPEVNPVNWLDSIEDLPKQLNALEPYYVYTSELPGVRPIQNSFNFSVDLIRRSINNSNRQPSNPGFGKLELDIDHLNGLA